MRMRPAVALLLAGLSVMHATYASPVSRDYDGTPRAADSYRYGGGYYKLGRTLTGNLDFQGPPLDQGSIDDGARQGQPGPQGATGARGATGPQGATGAKGATGPQGATGAAGIPGTAGVAGPQGSTGARGTTGPQGVTGARGATGAAGAPGTAGIAGPAGLAGPQGTTGARGATGAAGVPGVAGPAGIAGVPGPAGLAGPQGTAGARGATGAAGVPGAAGPVGPLGPAGPVGASGTAGPQGTPGARGATGAAGGPGPVGTPGPQGTTGAGGAAGNVGAAGPQGTTGARGATGGGGPQGSPGARGPQGTPGADGFAGPAGPEGPAGPAGPEGPEGPIGAPGSDGPPGPEGPPGTPGAAGVCASGQAYVTRSTAQVTSMACANTEVCVAAQCDGNPVINGGCSTGFSTPYCVDDHGVDADCATQSPTSSIVGWACGANTAEGLSATVTCCGTRPGQTCANPRIAQTGVNSFDNTPATQVLWVPCSNNLLDKAVWYKWTAESDSIISVTTCQGQEAPGDTMLAVFNSCPDSEPAKKHHDILYTCNDNGGDCGSGSALAFRAFAGKAYYIVVGSVSGGDAVRGEFTIAPIEPSIGQLCVNPLTAQTGVNSFDNTLAVENGYDLCRGRKAIWYQWTAQWTSTVSVTTCQGEESPGDTVLAVFSSCDAPGALMACNDDGGTCSGGSALAFSAVAGQTYFIAVGSYLEETLAGQLTIAPEPPIGSMCTIPKTAVVGDNTFDTTHASEDRSLPGCDNNYLVDWFVFTAPESANYEVSTCPANVDTVVYVYSGAECGSLEGVICADGGYCPDGWLWWPTTFGFDAKAGETYWILIGSYDGARFANQPWTIRKNVQPKALPPQKPIIQDPRPPQPDCPLCNPVDKPPANQTLVKKHTPLAQHT